MQFINPYKNLFSKINDFFYAVGFFSEIIMFILVVVLLFNNHIDLLVFIIGINLNAILNNYLKSLIKQPRPEHPIKFLNSEHFDSKKEVYGMPSGHSQNVFFSITYLYLCNSHVIPWVLVGGFIFVLMFIERWLFHNHTIAQLIAGGIIGTIFAYIIVYLSHKTFKLRRI
jgi:membrane-associated phospholipid phosphatase